MRITGQRPSVSEAGLATEVPLLPFRANATAAEIHLRCEAAAQAGVQDATIRPRLNRFGCETSGRAWSGGARLYNGRRNSGEISSADGQNGPDGSSRD